MKLAETKPNKQAWGMAGSVVLVVVGLLFAQFFIVKGARWFKQTRERRITKASDSVTPDRLTARCVKPAQDVTTDLYPILIRTMLYECSFMAGERIVERFDKNIFVDEIAGKFLPRRKNFLLLHLLERFVAVEGFLHGG